MRWVKDNVKKALTEQNQERGSPLCPAGLNKWPTSNNCCSRLFDISNENKMGIVYLAIHWKIVVLLENYPDYKTVEEATVWLEANKLQRDSPSPSLTS